MLRYRRKFWTEVAKRRVAASQRFECAKCLNRLGRVWAADHIVALRNGGTNSLDNCQILCPACHAEKTQDEQIAAVDCRREAQTKVSKYFDTTSIYFINKSYMLDIPPPSVDLLKASVELFWDQFEPILTQASVNWRMEIQHIYRKFAAWINEYQPHNMDRISSHHFVQTSLSLQPIRVVYRKSHGKRYLESPLNKLNGKFTVLNAS
jgi:hypothetical protein